MQLRHAIEMLAGGDVGGTPATWADLGCGDGTFTLALADRLAEGSTIHAMDREAAALRDIPRAHAGVRIETHRGNFVDRPWPFDGLDGILMANSLHYVREQAAFIRRCEPDMKPSRRFLVIEYDTDEANRWVPYPVSLSRLTALFEAAGYSRIVLLASRPSRYQHAALYSALIEP